MSTITLKDNHFHIIGYIEEKANGDKILKDEHFHIRGYYDSNINATKNEHFHIIGYGDLLTTLL